MNTMEMIFEQSPINIPHDTYRRECRYTRGIHITEQDFRNILATMNRDSKLYFEFHNSNSEIKKGAYFNGHAGLAEYIARYFLNEKNIEIVGLTNGKDFYVKII